MSSGPDIKSASGNPEGVLEKTLDILVRATCRINRWIVAVSSVALLGAALVLTLSVVLRYFLKVPTDWQDEVAVFLIVGSLFMCSAYVQSFRGHIGIEALSSILPKMVNRVRLFMVDCASFAFCAFFSWKSWAMLQESFIGGHTTSSAFAPPLWIPYGLLAIGMTNLTLQLLLQIPSHFLAKKVPS
jgi:TRAP-type C4-dicarboxylate transport system permease small subunit